MRLGAPEVQAKDHPPTHAMPPRDGLVGEQNGPSASARARRASWSALHTGAGPTFDDAPPAAMTTTATRDLRATGPTPVTPPATSGHGLLELVRLSRGGAAGTCSCDGTAGERWYQPWRWWTNSLLDDLAIADLGGSRCHSSSCASMHEMGAAGLTAPGTRNSRDASCCCAHEAARAP